MTTLRESLISLSVCSGNLKGLILFVNQWYPSVVQFMTSGANAGGINVMTYDLRYILPACSHLHVFR